MRAIVDEPDIDLDGGREFKSGAMMLLYGVWQASSEDGILNGSRIGVSGGKQEKSERGSE